MSPLVIHTEIIVHAPIDVVWHCLVDVDRYPIWNPFIVGVHRNGASTDIGTMMRFTLRWPFGFSGRSIEEVTQINPPNRNIQDLQTALWQYDYRGLPYRLGLLRVSRIQTVTQHSLQQTLYSSTLRFEGIGRHWVPKNQIRKGCTAQAQGLAAQF